MNFMTVKDFIDNAQFGTKILIVQSIFFAEGDDVNDVFSGIVGQIGKCKYLDYRVDYYRILSDNTVELNISRIG